jgi:Endopolygalacturonase
MHFFECKNVRAEKVIIRSRGLSNNDGIDVDCCDGVLIKDCDIDSGDDAVCLKTTGPKPCRNIEVTGCKMNTGQGAFKIGTETFGNFENIRVHHCRVENTKGIKLYSVDGAHLKNLEISNITIEKTSVAIMIRLGARLKVFRESAFKKMAGSISGLKISDIKVNNASQIAFLISGVPESFVENVSLSNISVRLSGGGSAEAVKAILPENESDYPEVTMFGKVMPAYGMYIRHAQGIKFDHIMLNTETADARPAIVGSDLTRVTFNDWKMPVTVSDEPLIMLEKAKTIQISAMKPLQRPSTLLRVEGAESEKISIQADPGQVKRGNGVAIDAVSITK